MCVECWLNVRWSDACSCDRTKYIALFSCFSAQGSRRCYPKLYSHKYTSHTCGGTHVIMCAYHHFHPSCVRFNARLLDTTLMRESRPTPKNDIMLNTMFSGLKPNSRTESQHYIIRLGMCEVVYRMLFEKTLPFVVERWKCSQFPNQMRCEQHLLSREWKWCVFQRVFRERFFFRDVRFMCI